MTDPLNNVSLRGTLYGDPLPIIGSAVPQTWLYLEVPTEGWIAASDAQTGVHRVPILVGGDMAKQAESLFVGCRVVLQGAIRGVCWSPLKSVAAVVCADMLVLEHVPSKLEVELISWCDDADSCRTRRKKLFASCCLGMLYFHGENGQEEGKFLISAARAKLQDRTLLKWERGRGEAPVYGSGERLRDEDHSRLLKFLDAHETAQAAKPLK